MLKTGLVLRKLLIIAPVVLALTAVSLFIPLQRVSIEGIGILSVGSEVAYASPDVTLWLNPNNNEPASNWTNPQWMYVSDNDRASTVATGGDAATVKLYDFGISIPSGSVINGIEVDIEASCFYFPFPPTDRRVRARLMWNGRTSETGYKETPNVGFLDQYYTLGGPADTWGRTWSVDDFSNANFAVRVTSNFSGGFFSWLSVDHVRVRVHYTPPPDISNTPDIYDFQTVQEGVNENTGTGYFYVTNNSTVNITVTIVCNGWTDTTDSTSPWIYGLPAANTAQLKASDGDGAYDVTVDDATPATLHTTSTPGDDFSWELQLDAPTSFTHGHSQQTMVTLTATAS